MEFSAPFKVIILIVVTGVSQCQNYQWTPCSRTCGQGTRRRRCGPSELHQCLVKYEDCTLKTCPDVTCCASSVLKYNSPSECCKKVEGASCGVVHVQATSRRVVGGQISEDGQWPWLAALWQKKPKKYFCGGGLVNEKWVVTAAHCFELPGYTAQDVMVKLGMSKQVGRNPNVQTTDVEEYIKHPSFKDWPDDLALLKLRTSMRYSTHIQPICMPSSEQPDQDTICYVAGWGYASHADIQAERTSNTLLHAGLRVVPLDACKEAYMKETSYSGVTNKTLCVGILSGGKDSCGGDSGSPLVCQRKTSCQWYFAGVVSFGATACGAKNSPAVYTNVRDYENWILDQIAPHPCKSFPCQNGGTCIRFQNDYVCRCNNPYAGKHCHKERPCTPNPCQNGGSCSKNFAGTVKCACLPGYEGGRCKKKITCKPNPCQNGGTCSINLGGTVKCACLPGYEEARCQKITVGKWLPCSRSCGGGFRFKIEQCADPNKQNCKKTYQGCNIRACPALSSCPWNHQFRYRDSSSCCRTSTETCGVEIPSTAIAPFKIWPWLATILLLPAGSLKCVGALLSKDWVLTAAHCVEPYQLRDIRVLLGTSTIKVLANTHQIFEIGSTIVHENYDYPRNNIALMKLSKSAVLHSSVKPICLPSLEKVKQGATCLVVGYDFPLSQPYIRRDSTTENFLSLLPLDVCRNDLKSANQPDWNKITVNNHLCVGQFEGKTSKYKCLPYVSGSPLICQRCSSCGWYLAGLSEFGVNECGKAPDVYTNVYNFEDWIRRQISLPRTSTFSCPT